MICFLLSGWRLLLLGVAVGLGAGAARAQTSFALPTPQVEWERSFGSDGFEQLATALPTTDGGYLLAGSTSAEEPSGDVSQPARMDHDKEYHMGGGRSDFWVVKIDAHGHKQWETRLGGTHDDELMAAIVTPDGGFLLVGTTESDGGGDMAGPIGPDNGPDGWLVKISARGRKQWDLRLGGSSVEWVTTAALAADGGYLVGGCTASPAGAGMTAPPVGDYDAWVFRVSAQGKLQWSVRAGKERDSFEVGQLLPTADGGCLAVAYSGPAWLALKLRANGGIEWTRVDSLRGLSGFREAQATRVQATSAGYHLEGNYQRDPVRLATQGDNSIYSARRWLLDLTAGGIPTTPTYSRLPARATSYPAPSGGSFLISSPDSLTGQGFQIELQNAAGRGCWQWRHPDTRFPWHALRTALPTADGGWLLAGSARNQLGTPDPARQRLRSNNFWVVKLAPLPACR